MTVASPDAVTPDETARPGPPSDPPAIGWAPVRKPVDPLPIDRMLGRPFGVDVDGSRIAHGPGRTVVGAVDYLRVVMGERAARAAPPGLAPSEREGLVQRAQENAVEQLVAVVAPDLPTPVGDRDRLIQVLINLLSNAVKFTPAGRASIRAAADADRVVVTVTDTGVGIPPEDHEKVWESVRQAGATLIGKPRGTGLGLPICRQIVEHHGGRMWLESTVGAGSPFAFWLPIDGGDREAPAPPAVPPVVDGGRATDDGGGQARRPTGPDAVGSGPASWAGPHARETVGAASTEAARRSGVRRPGGGGRRARSHPGGRRRPGDARLLRQSLEAAGYHVDEAPDGETGLRRVGNRRPDVLILDLRLPELDGLQVIERIRAEPDGPSLPIVVLSVADEGERARRAGADRYLAEPFAPDGLLVVLRELLATDPDGPEGGPASRPDRIPGPGPGR